MTLKHRKDQKRWGRQQAELHFIQSDDEITLRELSKESGIPDRTIQRWAAKDNWREKRAEYWRDVAKRADQKLIDSITQYLPESRAKIAATHFERNRKIGNLADLLVSLRADRINKAIARGDKKEIDREVNRDLIGLNYLSLVIERACKGEAAAIGLRYDINEEALVVAAENRGFKLIESKYLEELQNAANISRDG